VLKPTFAKIKSQLSRFKSTQSECTIENAVKNKLAINELTLYARSMREWGRQVQ